MTAAERAAERITQLEARIKELEAWQVSFMVVMEGIALLAGAKMDDAEGKKGKSKLVAKVKAAKAKIDARKTK